MRRSTLLLAAGGLIVLVGAILTLTPWVEGLRAQGTPEIQQAQRNAAAPVVVRTAAATDATVTRPTPLPTRGAASAAAPAGATPTALGTSANASGPQAAGTTPACIAPPSDSATGGPPSTGNSSPPADSRPAEASAVGPCTLPVGAPPEASRGGVIAAGAVGTPAAQTGVAGLPVSASGVAPRADDGPGPAVEAVPEPTLVPTATPAPAVLQLVGASFEFVEPPQPGATARLALTVRNPSTAPQGPLTVSLPQEWLAGYRVEGIVPLPTDGTLDGQRAAGQQRFALPAPEPGADQEVSFWVVTTAEVIDAPAARVLDAQGREIGRAQPVTEAPPPLAPGPVYSLEIPRLRIQTGVVQVDWEPPLFVVGQLKASAPVTQGNSVLVGHVRGAAGYNVFDHLNQVAVGDTVIAHSRGMAYEFVVRSTEILPPTDVTPTEPTDSPQLTLMTCAGDWNPLTQEYSERLWIVADPVGGPDQSAPARRASAPPSRAPAGAAAIAPGGLGASDQDLASTYAAPVGESATHLAVYRTRGVEHRARLVEVPGDVAASRASAVVLHAPDGAPWALDEAIRQSRELLPRDTQPRAVQPEGNQRFVVERFTSPALATLFPDGAFTPGRGAAGDLLVVYVRRSDGRIGDVVVGLGNSPDALLALL